MSPKGCQFYIYIDLDANSLKRKTVVSIDIQCWMKRVLLDQNL